MLTLNQFFNSKDKICVNLNTEEEDKKFREEASKLGYTWSSGTSYKELSFFYMYKENTCYTNKGKYARKQFFESEDYEILTLQDFKFNFLNEGDY